MEDVAERQSNLKGDREGNESDRVRGKSTKRGCLSYLSRHCEGQSLRGLANQQLKNAYDLNSLVRCLQERAGRHGRPTEGHRKKRLKGSINIEADAASVVCFDLCYVYCPS